MLRILLLLLLVAKKLTAQPNANCKEINWEHKQPDSAFFTAL